MICVIACAPLVTLPSFASATVVLAAASAALEAASLCLRSWCPASAVCNSLGVACASNALARAPGLPRLVLETS